MARQLEKILYTAHTHTTGGRDGAGRSSDGALDVSICPRKAHLDESPVELAGRAHDDDARARTEHGAYDA